MMRYHVEDNIATEKEIQEIIAVSVGCLSCLLKSDSSVPIERGILTGISYLMTMGASKLTNIHLSLTKLIVVIHSTV